MQVLLHVSQRVSEYEQAAAFSSLQYSGLNTMDRPEFPKAPVLLSQLANGASYEHAVRNGAVQYGAAWEGKGRRAAMDASLHGEMLESVVGQLDRWCNLCDEALLGL